ncbi:lytic transglycosylase domain-containing protein [Aureimonas pseudogalii]|uniref:Soluble lytic murein transglycosylase-like protein n=1 Tax=Aureimonas pseudogalii TaxID=1744844 RepID=A0A7W6H411_9HYPH|nr:transglycosylase SLT domain-containing protein [Aureimonas pseudogalii]MBB3996469.1 soluble lytic murein transglycosylase-like protein [Aureimonas pseudogalii]
MTIQRAEGDRSVFKRSSRLASVAAFALLAPLTLSACVSDGDKLTGTANLAPAAETASSSASSTSTARPEITKISLADNGPSRVTVPSGRPVAAATTSGAETARGGRVVVAAAKASSAETARDASSATLTTRAVAGAAAAKTVATNTVSAAKDGAVAAKDSVVAGASRVGAGAVAVANVSVQTVKTVAQAVGDTITGDPKIDRLIAQAADDNEIPRELAYAVVRVESHYNPRARGSGVYGLSQIKPATARGLGFSGPTEALLDPETNLRYGMRYLKGAWEQGGGDVCQTAMKYKGGHRTTTMSKSASVYCSNVKRHMAAIRSRKSPAMSSDSTLIAAVEPTVRAGIIERTVAAKPVLARVAATNAVAAAPQSASPAATAMTSQAPASGAAAAVGLPKTVPVPAVNPVRVADNSSRPAAAANGGIPVGRMVGGRVVRPSAAAVPQPDIDRFGGAFDASTPATTAPAGGLGFN